MPASIVTTFIRSRNPRPVLRTGDRWSLQPVVTLAIELARLHPTALLAVSCSNGNPPTIVTDISHASIVAAIATLRNRPNSAGWRYCRSDGDANAWKDYL